MDDYVVGGGFLGIGNLVGGVGDGLLMVIAMFTIFVAMIIIASSKGSGGKTYGWLSLFAGGLLGLYASGIGRHSHYKGFELL